MAPVVTGPVEGLARLQVDADLPAITLAQNLMGWRREFCVELLGDGAARVFVRVVAQASCRAPELQRGVLFHRLDSRFSDMAACADAIRVDLERLALTARRAVPDKSNLFITLVYDREAWERVQQGVDRWARR